jgi:hypothetical protein
MSRFRPNTPPVVHETIEDETIIVNLDAGLYYALNRSGSRIWTELERGTSMEDLVASMARRSATSASDVDRLIATFVEKLIAEGLVVADEDGEVPANASVEWPDGVGFEAPTLSRYTDMQELLLLDPVHDIGVGGWAQER